MKNRFKYSVLPLMSVIISVCISVMSCADRQDTVKGVTISEQTMVDIMRDMTRANYMLNTVEKDSVDKSEMRMDYKITICKHYNTTPEEYDHDLKLYLSNTEVMQRILEKAKQNN